jgi:hypothetical protein
MVSSVIYTLTVDFIPEIQTNNSLIAQEKIQCKSLVFKDYLTFKEVKECNQVLIYKKIA